MSGKLKRSPQAQPKGKVSFPEAAAVVTATTSVQANKPIQMAPSQAIAGEGVNLFGVASMIEQQLKGLSNKEAMKVLMMVGSIHGARIIPIDRPIGLSNVGKIRPATAGEVSKSKRGVATPPAAYKQTDAYKRLVASRMQIVTTIKSLSPAELSKTTYVDELREIEQKLKLFKSSTAGGQ
jgi:hypothetical protein